MESMVATLEPSPLPTFSTKQHQPASTINRVMVLKRRIQQFKKN
jgi:hypothetical protein